MWTGFYINFFSSWLQILFFQLVLIDTKGSCLMKTLKMLSCIFTTASKTFVWHWKRLETESSLGDRRKQKDMLSWGIWVQSEKRTDNFGLIFTDRWLKRKTTSVLDNTDLSFPSRRTSLTHCFLFSRLLQDLHWMDNTYSHHFYPIHLTALYFAMV